MGVSRSASTVIAYAMKEFGWSLEKAYNFVKQKRSITRPNPGFMRQLAEYEGILDARYSPSLSAHCFSLLFFTIQLRHEVLTCATQYGTWWHMKPSQTADQD